MEQFGKTLAIHASSAQTRAAELTADLFAAGAEPPTDLRGNGRWVLWLRRSASRPKQLCQAARETCSERGGAWVPPHMHQAEEEAWYVLEGELTFRIGDRTIPAPAGSFILVPRGTLHSFANTGGGPARYLQLFSPRNGALLC